MVFNVLIGDLCFIQIFLDLLQPAVLVARHYFAPRCSSQRDMNEAYSAKADIYIAFRLQLMSKYLTITLIYSAALPLAYGLAAAFLWLVSVRCSSVQCVKCGDRLEVSHRLSLSRVFYRRREPRPSLW